jgi:plastocyanin
LGTLGLENRVDMRTDVQARRYGWPDLERTAGIVELVLIGAVAVALRDIDATLTAIGFAASLLLLRFRGGLLGQLGLGLAFALTAFWSITAAAVNLSQSPGFFGSALPSVLSVLSVVGIAGWVGRFVSHRSSGTPRSVSVAAVALVVVALVASAISSSETRVGAKSGDIKLVTKHVKFSSKHLQAQAGRVGILITNKDFFWHTFTIKKLDLNLKVPTRGERRFEFTAPAGTYEFVCLIPGHQQAGMKGTLIVR